MTVERSSAQVRLQNDILFCWIILNIVAQTGESHSFLGNEMTAKEGECVLIYDEETGVRQLVRL